MKQLIPFAIFVIVVIAGCANKYEKLTQELKTTKNYDNKPITVEGHIYVPMITFGSKFKVTSGGQDTYYGISGDVILENVKLQDEGQKNSIIFIDKNKVELYDNNGEKFNLDDKVRIQGLIKYTYPDKKDDFTYTVIDVVMEKL